MFSSQRGKDNYVMDVLNNPIMVTISQYICISNHGVALLKVIQFVNYISINMGKISLPLGSY